jgi:hypothetical protein
MDPETVETLVLLAKFILIMGGGCAAVVGTLYALVAGTVHYCQRKDHRDELMPLYVEGRITTKPTIFNAYSIAGHGS